MDEIDEYLISKKYQPLETYKSGRAETVVYYIYLFTIVIKAE